MFSKKMNKKEVELLQEHNFKKTVYSSLFITNGNSNGKETGWERGNVRLIKVSKGNFSVENVHFTDLKEAIDHALKLKEERTFNFYPEITLVGVEELKPVSWGSGQQGGARVILEFSLNSPAGERKMTVRHNFDFLCNNTDFPKGCFDDYLEAHKNDN